MVQANWGLAGLGPINDVVVLSPFVVIQFLIWCGLFFAERALQIRVAALTPGRLGRYLVLRSRQSLGLLLPVILLFVIRRDVFRRFWPSWEDGPLAEPIEMALLGSMVLVAVAAVHSAGLAHPLVARRAAPPSARARRADRAGFRFTDVLIWDTGDSVLNACVTGIVPGFRYVLLTDALVDTMTPLEVAAVFGHEIGHIAHRHLLYFGFFFAGSLGVLTLLADGLSMGFGWVARSPWLPAGISPHGRRVDRRSRSLLLVLGLYFWLVFGYLSRRFERQADVYGSKVVSCELADCPPHFDLENELAPDAGEAAAPPLCPVGLRIFAEALAIVAQCNGLDRDDGPGGTAASPAGSLPGAAGTRSRARATLPAAGCAAPPRPGRRDGPGDARRRAEAGRELRMRCDRGHRYAGPFDLLRVGEFAPLRPV